MSFNPNDNNPSIISRNNYEEYFLLYADNELTEAERLQVEQFLMANPDLQTELDLLLSTKLPLEQVRLENKESLLAESMKLNAIDEALLLYIDNELDEAEKLQVEEKLKRDKAYQIQYEGLLQTKPGIEDVITYPYKKELYRYEEKRRFPVYWMRIAAAVIILAGMGIFVYTYQQKPGVSVAYDPAKIEQKQKPAPGKPTRVEPIKTDVATTEVQPVIKSGATDDVPNVVRHIKKKSQQKEIRQPVTTPPAEQKPEAVAKNDQKEPEQKNMVVTNKREVASQQTINKNDVTLPPVAAFDNHTTQPVTAVQTDVVKTDNEKKSTLKGFLRKATRFIERRTNISTTNENDELLIGAVALKL
jgi:hypothetical protein